MTTQIPPPCPPPTTYWSWNWGGPGHKGRLRAAAAEEVRAHLPTSISWIHGAKYVFV